MGVKLKVKYDNISELPNDKWTLTCSACGKISEYKNRKTAEVSRHTYYPYCGQCSYLHTPNPPKEKKSRPQVNPVMPMTIPEGKGGYWQYGSSWYRRCHNCQRIIKCKSKELAQCADRTNEYCGYCKYSVKSVKPAMTVEEIKKKANEVFDKLEPYFLNQFDHNMDTIEYHQRAKNKIVR